MTEPLDLVAGRIHDPNETPAGYLDFVDSRFGTEPQERITVGPHRIFKIGRAPRFNDFAIQDSDSMVSRSHCEIYAVVYEPSIYHVYVRDRNSANGTFVNGKLVGAGPMISSGYLLEDGDEIEIRPNWKFIFQQGGIVLRHDLTSIQTEECSLFADKYLLTNRCLGEGAEAAVYLAIDVITKKQLVCKLVNLDKQHSRSAGDVRRRTFQETDILRQLQHPNILAYVDSISSPHSLYTFTELASGGDLWSFIYRHDLKVAEFDARIIIRQVVRGLQYLHKRGIVHRDLKPENILLAYSPKNVYHRVMLSDFGASAVPRRSRMMTMTGTAGYQAPEQMNRNIQTDTADMWALGVVVLSLFAPFIEINIESLAQMDQVSIDQRIKDIISKHHRPVSSNGKHFTRECLRLSADNRLTADKAASHDWLCAAEHMEFFRKLDERMMADFRMQDQLRPITLELPSTALELHKHENGDPKTEIPESSGYFKNIEPDVVNLRVISQAHTLEIVQEHSKSSDEINVTPSHAKYTKPIYAMSAPSRIETDIIGQRTQPKAKRQRTNKSKTTDSDFLPLTGLDKHLPPPTSNCQREQVLAELKRTSAVFLPSSPKASFIGSPITGPNSKRQREPCQ